MLKGVASNNLLPQISSRHSNVQLALLIPFFLYESYLDIFKVEYTEIAQTLDEFDSQQTQQVTSLLM